MRASTLCFVLALCGSMIAAAQGTCSGTATQAVRTTWTSDGSTFYLYDITGTNTGTEAVSLEVVIQAPMSGAQLDVSQIWNVETLANTDETGHTLITVLFDSSQQKQVYIAPGQTWTGTGYVTNNTGTFLTTYPHCLASSTSTGMGSGATTSSVPSSSTSGAASSGGSGSSASSSSSSSECTVSVSQNLRQTWQSNNVNFYLYDVTLTNTGSSSVTSPSFFIRPTDNQSSFALSQTWNLVTYASTTQDQQIVSLQPNTVIAPGASYTGAGYVVQASHTQLQLDTCA